MIFNEKIKFFNIVYLPFTGGNHLVNLLSLNKNVKSKLHVDSKITVLDYYKQKLNSAIDGSISKIQHRADYVSKGFNVHIYDTTNVFPTPYLVKNEKCVLVHGHYEDYETNLYNNFIKNIFFKNLPFTLCCLISVPKNKESRLYKRFANSEIFNNFIIQKSLSNYIIPFNVSGYRIFDNTNALLIDSDLFGEEKGSDYLQQLLFENFKFELPNDIHEIHKTWIKMVDIGLDNK